MRAVNNAMGSWLKIAPLATVDSICNIKKINRIMTETMGGVSQSRNNPVSYPITFL